MLYHLKVIVRKKKKIFVQVIFSDLVEREPHSPGTEIWTMHVCLIEKMNGLTRGTKTSANLVFQRNSVMLFMFGFKIWSENQDLRVIVSWIMISGRLDVCTMRKKNALSFNTTFCLLIS